MCRFSIPQLPLCACCLACCLLNGRLIHAQETAQAESSEAGSTADGVDTRTADGVASGEDSGGGTAGSNAAESFVGGNNAGDFVGGTRQSENNNAASRFFRAITGQEVPTGGTTDASGDPRRIPFRLSLGFARPAPRDAIALAGRSGVEIRRFARRRPQWRAVSVQLNDAGLLTLTGIVPDASSRRLAANLLRLQPGVRKIDNQLEVRELPPAVPKR